MAQAVNLVETEDSKVDMYGRLVLQIQNTDETSEIEDNGSRIGFKINHAINDDLSTYGRVEFRFNADERQRADDGVFDDLRNTYIGLKGDFGDVRVVNFDTVYYELVSAVFDVPEDNGYVTLDGGSTKGRGDAIAYLKTAGPLDIAVQATHQPEDPDAGQDEELNLMGAVRYNMDAVAIGLGINQCKSCVGGEDEAIIGASVTVKTSDAVSVYGLGETQKDNKNVYALGASYGYGKGDVYTQAALEDFDDTNADELISYMIGGNYDLNEKTYLFAELYDDDSDGDNYSVTLGARLNF
jgi:predicted porin